MSSSSPRLVLRYLPAQRLVHWVGVVSFVTLLVSGLVLLFPPFAFLATAGFSRLLHRLAAVPFVVLPPAYALLLPRQARELLRDSFTYTREDWSWLARLPGYLLGKAHGLPPQGRLNAGQKLHHAATFLMFVTVAASGFALWFGKGRLGPAGLAASATVHDLSMLGLTALMIGHVYFTFLYHAISGMWTGYVSEEYARTEHRNWLDSLQPRTSAGQPAASPAAPAGGARGTQGHWPKGRAPKGG